MTDAEQKAREIVTKFRDGVTRHPQIVDGYLKVLTSAIAAAIESARQDERERARRLVDAAKRVLKDSRSNEFGELADAVSAYEVQP